MNSVISIVMRVRHCPSDLQGGAGTMLRERGLLLPSHKSPKERKRNGYLPQRNIEPILFGTKQ